VVCERWKGWCYIVGPSLVVIVGIGIVTGVGVLVGSGIGIGVGGGCCCWRWDWRWHWLLLLLLLEVVGVGVGGGWCWWWLVLAVVGVGGGTGVGIVSGAAHTIHPASSGSRGWKRVPRSSLSSCGVLVSLSTPRAEARGSRWQRVGHWSVGYAVTLL